MISELEDDSTDILSENLNSQQRHIGLHVDQVQLKKLWNVNINGTTKYSRFKIREMRNRKVRTTSFVEFENLSLKRLTN